jgi:uncharacterized membrane protein
MLSLGFLLSELKASPSILIDLAPFLNLASYLLVNPVPMAHIYLLHISTLLNFTATNSKRLKAISLLHTKTIIIISLLGCFCYQLYDLCTFFVCALGQRTF